MQLTEQDILHLAHLAHLSLRTEEVEVYQEKLTSLIEHFHVLNEVNTDDLEPVTQVTDLLNVLGQDTPHIAHSTPEELLQCSPLPLHRKQITVPSVL